MSESQQRSSGSTIVTMALVLLGLLALVALFSVLKSRLESSLKGERQVEQAKVQPVPSRPEADDGPVLTVSPISATEDVLELEALLDAPTAVPNEAVLTFDNADALNRFLRSAGAHGLQVLARLDGLNGVRVGFSDVESLAKYLKSQADSPDRPQVEPHMWLMTPPLPRAATDNQGGAQEVGTAFLESINATGDRSQWGKGVTVAVLDTGIEDHPTFGSDRVTHLDLVQDGKVPHSHGTSVASLVAGEDEQAPGVAPAATLLDIRVANEKGISVTTVLAQGIVEAVDRGAQVISGAPWSTPLRIKPSS
jgi:subtilisin family serine protease